MPLMESVSDFARAGYFGPDLSQLILRYGRPSQIGPVPEVWSEIRLPKKQCFQNAAELAFQHPEDLLYVEGYAFADIEIHMPLAHAWLETREGFVVDPTWQKGSGYFGIPFSAERLAGYLAESEQYGILQSLWIVPKLREQFLADLQIA